MQNPCVCRGKKNIERGFGEELGVCVCRREDMKVPSSSGSGSGSSKATPCCSKVGIKRGPWTPEEDEVLADYVKKEGVGRWRTLPKRAGLQRCGKSCRLRWMNYLRPSVKRGHIAPDEEDLILRLHRLLGNRWSLIAGRIPGRTDNEIKNYWNTHLSKKLINQGIDPRTHKPLETYPSHEPVGETGNTFVPASSVSLPPQPPLFICSTPEKANEIPQHQMPFAVQDDIQRVTHDKEQQQIHDPVQIGTGKWQSSRETLMGINNAGEGSIIGQSYVIDNFNNEEYIYSSLLENLMYDNYVSPYQLPENNAIPPPHVFSLVSPCLNFNTTQGDMQDAELIKSALETIADQPSHNNNVRNVF